MKPYQDKLKDHTSMVPHYAIWECPYCELEGYDTYQYPNCLCKGMYCAPDPGILNLNALNNPYIHKMVLAH